MKEFFAKNKFQITVLLAVLLFVSIIGIGVIISQNDLAQKKVEEEMKEEEAKGQVSSMMTTREVTEALTGALEDAGQIQVNNNTSLTPKSYSYKIQQTDSQTRAVRKIITEFSKTYRQFDNWERTYLETKIVNELGRKENVRVGEKVEITHDTITNYAQRLASIDSNERARWEKASKKTIFFDNYNDVITNY